jgi:echinoderm microtubule-associated protein-like 6
MGQSIGRARLLQETQIFATCIASNSCYFLYFTSFSPFPILLGTLNDVKELAKRFRTQVFGYALVEAQFESIISFKENMTKNFSLEILFDTLDNDNDGRIDGLELLAGLTLCCHGEFEEKAKFCFELFDFNLNASLSQKEMVVMMMASICGLNVLTGGDEDEEPELETFEKLAGNAFLRADKDKSGSISCEEFISWARSNREMMATVESLSQVSAAAKLDLDSEDSAEVMSEDNFSDLDFGTPPPPPPYSSEIVFDDDITGAGGADHFSAILKWKTIENEPTNFRPSRLWNDGPESNLTLSWVHGMRGKDGRNFLRYVTDGEMSSKDGKSIDTIVYPSAELTVVYNLKKKTQRTYQGHRDQITSLSLHPAGRIVATADASSCVHIWDPLTLEFLCEIKGMGKAGIQLLQFAPNGASLVTVGSDLDRTIAIYDTSTGEVISSTKGFTSPNNIFDIAYSSSGNELCAVGRRGSIMFYKNIKSKQRALRGVSGMIGRIGKKQTFFCVVYCGHDEVVVGCASGEIYKFLNGKCGQVIQAHNSCEPVLCMFFDPLENTLVTGGKDGTVRTWTSNLKEVGNELDLAEDLDGDGVADNKSLDNAVVSVHCVGNKILVGTKGSDIFEAVMPLVPTDPMVLTQLAWGHATGELWGLATHPTRDEFATSGDDKTLRIWSIRTNEMINRRTLPIASRTVAYNPTGSLLAVGMQDGSVGLLDSSKLRVKSLWKHANYPITDVKFSYDEYFLATASADGNIYLYKSNDRLQYYRQAVCQGHVGIVSHIDFSLNGKYLQSCGEDSALYYWDMNGNLINSSNIMRDVDWVTWTCTLGWPVQGIYSPNTPSFNYINTCHAIPEVGVLATGDDDGLVQLFRYPSLDPGAIRQAHYGHAGNVTCVRFTANRRHLISISGSDRTIIVWRHELELIESSDEEDMDPDEEYPPLPQLDYRLEIADVGERTVMEEAVHRQQSTQELMELYQQLHPHQVLTPMPWRSCVVEPEKWAALSESTTMLQYLSGATDVDLTLSWVHGYRSYDCRNNVRYNASGEIVYHSATLGIVYSKSTGKQRFLLGAHSDDILGMAAHPAGQIFATGEAGKHPSIVVWDGETARTLNRLTSAHTRGVSLLAFNSTGYFLASVGLDEESTLTIHEWKKSSLVMKTPTSKGRVLCLCFLAPGDGSGDSVSDMTKREIVVTGGESHLKFWSWSGQNVSSQNAIWDIGRKYLHPTIRICPDILCLSSASPMVCIAGTADGHLLVFKNYTCCAVYPNNNNSNLTHSSSPVQCMWSRKSSHALDSFLYFTGDQHGQIAIWEYHENTSDCDVLTNDYLRCLTSISANSLVFDPPLLLSHPEEQFLKNYSIRSICERDGIVLIGTQAADIIEIPYSLKKQTVNQPPALELLQELSVLILSGPGNGEVWGLATQEDFPYYFTSGEDCTIRCWNLNKNKLICRQDLQNNTSSRALTLRKIKDDLYHLAAGCNNGNIKVYSVKVSMKGIVMEVLVENLQDQVKDLREEDRCHRIIQAIAYSKDGRYLAAGSHDSRIFLYSSNEYLCEKILRGHTGSITHLDFGSITHSAMTLIDPAGAGGAQREETFLYLQSTCSNNELRFWSIVGSKSTEVSAVDAKDTVWFTHTCTMGWPVQGIWPITPDGAHITAVTRSFSYNEVPVLATADNYGRVRLFNYPSTRPGAPDKCYRGHSKNIRNISFTANDEYCVSTGGEDRSIFVWMTDIQEELAERQVLSLQQKVLESSSLGPLPTGGALVKQKKNFLEPIGEDGGGGGGGMIEPFIEKDSDDDDDEEFKQDHHRKKSKKRQTTNLHLWKSVIREPSSWTQSNHSETLPAASLELSYVYGYRGWDCRNNLGFADSSDEIVYHVAGVGVVLTVSDNTQIHNTDHADDILCLTVHPDGHTVATGEIGKNPQIILWDANTGVTLQTIRFHQRGVSHLQYTADGNYLISVGMDTDGTVAIHDCRTGAITGSGKIGRGVQVHVLAVGTGTNFMTGGRGGHVKFWDVANQTGGRVEFASKGGLFGKEVSSKCVTAAAYLGTDAVTGMSDGSLLLWKGRYNTKMERAHLGPVTSMTSIAASNSGANTGSSDTGPRILSAGRDGHVYMWNSQLVRLWDLDLMQSSPPAYSSQIQAIAFREGKLVLGTKAAEIYFVNLLSNEMKKLVSGHYMETAQVTALASHPTKPYFITGGDDLTVRLWNSKTRKQQAIALVKNKCRSCVYAPDGFQVALGLIDGKLVVLTDDLEVELMEATICKDSLKAMAYSPNGLLLAIGAEDSNIYLLETKNYNIQSILRGHQGGVVSVDWSKCNTTLQTCSRGSELFYWNMETREQILVPSTTRDCNWFTWTSLYGWPVQGIWPEHYKANVINCVDRSPDQRYLAIGDDFNTIKLYCSPCLSSTNSRFKEYRGHSSQVSNIKFSHNGQALYSVGGYDKCIMQYNVNSSKRR